MKALQAHPRNSTGIVVHSLHKSGTMFLYWFYERLARRNGYAFYSVNGEHDQRPAIRGLPPRFCECPVRSFRIEDGLDDAADLYRIFQIRDPRDILVSLYHSLGWRHCLENAEMEQRRDLVRSVSIDEYIYEHTEISVEPLISKIKPLFERLGQRREGDVLIKYETMVTDFPRWAHRAIEPFHFRMHYWKLLKLAIRYRNEFKLTQVRDGMPANHKRRVIPGGYKEQFRPATIHYLNERFEFFLRRFGYEV